MSRPITRPVIKYPTTALSFNAKLGPRVYSVPRLDLNPIMSPSRRRIGRRHGLFSVIVLEQIVPQMMMVPQRRLSVLLTFHPIRIVQLEPM